MKVLLLCPPVVQPVAPFLALPSLTAYLRREGHEVRQLDLNAELFLWLGEAAHAELFARLGVEHGLVAASKAALWRAKLLMMPALRERLRSPEAHRAPGAVAEELYENYCNLGLDSARGTRRGRAAFWDAVYGAFLKRHPWPECDAAGVSVFADTQAEPAQALARWLKARGQRGPLLAGGGLFSETAQSSGPHAAFRDFDGIAFYEGERTLSRFLRNPAAPQEVPNLLTWDARGRARPPRFAGEDMSMADLPTPDFSGLPLDGYCLAPLVLPVAATRACYWNKCAFCTLSERTSGGVFRQRRPEQVVEDLRILRDRHGARIFRFIDDSIPPPFMRKLVDLLLEARLGVEWACHLNVDPRYQDRDFQLRLRAAGCRLASFGLETASPRLRRLILKDPPRLDGVAALEDLMPSLQEAGVKVGLSVIVGLPTETREEASLTARFLEERRPRINFLASNYFSLQKSSTMHHRPEDYGIRLDPKHPRGFVPLSGMSHEEAHAAFLSLREKAASWAAEDPGFMAQSAVLPQAVLRVCLQEPSPAAARA